MPDYHVRQKEIQQILESIIIELRRNEEQFWQLVEAVPSVIVIINKQGNITYTNKRITDMFGYVTDELIGKSVDLLLPPHMRNEHVKHRASYFANPTNRNMGKGQKLVAYHKQGYEFPVEIGLGFIDAYDDTEAIAFIVDITERLEFEKNLEESKRILKKAQEMAHVGSWEVNLATGETYWSDEFFRICGLEPQSVTPSAELGFTIIHPDDRAKAAAAFEQTQQTFEPYKIEKRIVHPNGDVRWVISQGEISVDEITGEHHLSGIFIDITDRKEVEQQKIQLELERERTQLLTHFIQNVSHEFRTPLSIINSSVHVITRLDDPQKRLQKAELIYSQVEQTEHLIEMLMTMVKLETITHLPLRPINLNMLLKDVIRLVSHSFGGQSNIIFHPLKSHPKLLCNEDQLFSALKHILHNALRFTPPDGTITINVEVTDKYVIIHCQDTGYGIEEDDLPHIFESFWRKDKAHTTPGFGLGLTIAKKIIDLHHGKITVTSEPNKGTLVEVQLELFQS